MRTPRTAAARDRATVEALVGKAEMTLTARRREHADAIRSYNAAEERYIETGAEKDRDGKAKRREEMDRAKVLAERAEAERDELAAELARHVRDAQVAELEQHQQEHSKVPNEIETLAEELVAIDRQVQLVAERIAAAVRAGASRYERIVELARATGRAHAIAQIVPVTIRDASIITRRAVTKTRNNEHRDDLASLFMATIEEDWRTATLTPRERADYNETVARSAAASAVMQQQQRDVAIAVAAANAVAQQQQPTTNPNTTNPNGGTK